MNQLIMALTTVADQGDAKRLALQLVQQGLAACVQIDGPIESYFSWNGQLETSAEYRLTIKTHAERWSELTTWISEQHPYDEPQLIAFAASHASESYANWVMGQTQPG